jgi:hypothetical protein
MNDIHVNASFYAYEICAKPFPCKWDDKYNFVGSYPDANGNSEEMYSNMIKENKDEWKKGVPHTDLEIIKIDNNIKINNSFDLINNFIQLQKNEDKSYCIYQNLSDFNANKIKSLANQQDDHKILVGQNMNWIVFHTKSLKEFISLGFNKFIEKTGNVLLYQF